MRTLRWLLFSLVMGVTFGLVTSVTNDASATNDKFWGSVARVATYLLDAGWSWAALPVAVGYFARTRLLGVAAGITALMGATVEYYVYKSWPLWGSDGSFHLDDRVLFWGGVSFLVGPLLGGVGACARRPGLVGLIAGLTVPAGAALQMFLMPVGMDRVSVNDGSNLPEGTWVRWIVWVAATLGGAYAIARFIKEQNKRQPTTTARVTELKRSTDY